MTVGDLKRFLDDLDDDMPVVTSEYNSGYGGLFLAGAEVVETEWDSELCRYKEYGGAGARVVAIGPTFG